MFRMRVSLSIGYVGATHEDILDISDQEWNDCTSSQEREDLMLSYWKDWSNNYIDGGYSLIEKDENDN